MKDQRAMNSDETAKQTRCKRELRLVDQALQINPKSYWLWNHRRWTLESSPTPDWARELKLVDMLLDKDARNFHGWKYRRDVIANLPQRTPKDEFGFTTTKINQNFSNYSAWHYRSKLLTTTFTTAEEQQNAMQQDFEIVRNAVYTEPADQSAWLYQRWLLGKKPLPLAILGTCLLREDDRSALVFVFNQPTKITNPASISLTVDTEPVNHSGSLQSHYTPVHAIWLPTLPKGDEFVIAIEKDAFVSGSGGAFGGRVGRKVQLGDVQPGTVTIDPSHPIDSDPMTISTPETEDVVADARYQPPAIWSRESKSVEELVEVEPDSKWALLTLVYMMKEVTGRDEDAIRILEKLEKLDGMRAGYYRDLKSEFVLNRAINPPQQILASQTSPAESHTFTLTSVSLTSLPTSTLSNLYTIRHLDLSHNALRSMKFIEILPLLETIELEGNQIERVQGLGGLMRLRRVGVKGNRIRGVEGLRE
ncbi:hypothetical protein HK097_004329, partial [Rhizophlyctis rosea]